MTQGRKEERKAQGGTPLWLRPPHATGPSRLTHSITHWILLLYLVIFFVESWILLPLLMYNKRGEKNFNVAWPLCYGNRGILDSDPRQNSSNSSTTHNRGYRARSWHWYNVPCRENSSSSARDSTSRPYNHPVLSEKFGKIARKCAPFSENCKY